MKICLIYLANTFNKAHDKPLWNLEYLGLGYLQAILETKGHEVIIVNTALEKLTQFEVIYRIEKFNPQFCGFSPTCLTIKDTLEITKSLKLYNPSIHICLGGHHASQASKEILLNAFSVDTILRGYSESSIVDLINVISKNEYIKVFGLSFRDINGIICENSYCKNNSELPLFFPNHSDAALRSRSIGIYSTRGCENSCSFCSSPSFNKNQGISGIKMRTAINVVDEIEFFCEKVGKNNTVEISFVDDNFVTSAPDSKKRLFEIARLINQRELNVKCWFMCRTDTFNKDDINLLKYLRKTGFLKILLGIESGDNNTLEKYHKNTSVELNNAAIELLTECNFILHLTMILFHPFTSFDEIEKSSKYINSLMKMPNICFLSSYSSRLLAIPGTSIYTKIKKFKLANSPNSLFLNPLDYNFIDDRINILAEHMQILEPEIASSYWLMIDIRNIINEYSYFNNNNESEIKIFQSKICEIDNLVYSYFIKTLLFCKNGNKKLFRKETHTFLKIIINEFNKLILAFNSSKLNFDFINRSQNKIINESLIPEYENCLY